MRVLVKSIPTKKKVESFASQWPSSVPQHGTIELWCNVSSDSQSWRTMTAPCSRRKSTAPTSPTTPWCVWITTATTASTWGGAPLLGTETQCRGTVPPLWREVKNNSEKTSTLLQICHFLGSRQFYLFEVGVKILFDVILYCIYINPTLEICSMTVTFTV